ncbi:TnsA endonuclease N-terminal domain-containing protein, partial [Vibrio anguillarum]
MPDSNKPVHPADLKKLKTRGKGVGKDYEPFIYIHELSSLGESCRSNSATVGRVHHLLSRLELAAFLSFDYSSNTIDIREQFPIPIEDTLDICRQLGIKHPQVSGKLKVVTTDFLFDFKKQKQLALTVK